MYTTFQTCSPFSYPVIAHVVGLCHLYYDHIRKKCPKQIEDNDLGIIWVVNDENIIFILAEDKGGFLQSEVRRKD
jgi:uncharacterized protein (UPF0262 family)